MRITCADKFTRAVAPELASYEVTLNKTERASLEEACRICERAGELQTKALEHMGTEDDGSENDFEWARIYLANILRG